MNGLGAQPIGAPGGMLGKLLEIVESQQRLQILGLCQRSMGQRQMRQEPPVELGTEGGNDRVGDFADVPEGSNRG